MRRRTYRGRSGSHTRLPASFVQTMSPAASANEARARKKAREKRHLDAIPHVQDLLRRIQETARSRAQSRRVPDALLTRCDFFAGLALEVLYGERAPWDETPREPES